LFGNTNTLKKKRDKGEKRKERGTGIHMNVLHSITNKNGIIVADNDDVIARSVPFTNKHITIELLPYACETLHAITQHRAILACDTILEVLEPGSPSVLLEKHREKFEEDHVLCRVESIRELIVQYVHSPVHLEQIVSVVQRFRSQFEREKTSYDWMINACLERYAFHPYTAMNMFERAITLSPNNYEVYIYLSNLLNSDEFERPIDSVKCLHFGVAICDYLLSIEYNEFHLRRIMANRLVFLGRIESHKRRAYIDPQSEELELRYYQQALQIDPSAFHASFYLGFFYGFRTNYLRSSNIQIISPERERAFEKSIAHFERTLSMLDENKKIIFQSIIYNNIAAIRIQLHQFDEAMQWYAETLKTYEKMGWALRDRSFCLRNQRKYKEAIDSYSYCIDVLKPENPKTMAELLLTRTFWQMSCSQDLLASFSTHNTVNYLKDIDKVIETNPSNCFAWYLKSAVLWHTQKRLEACACLDEGISKCQDSNSAALFQLLERRAELYAMLGNNNGQQLQKYIDIAKNFAACHMRF